MKPVILIVEDDPALVELLEYNLKSAGFETAVVADGEAALLAIKEAPPDLVILDWMLPTMSGIEICRQLRARPEHRSLPVIMLTARSEEADRVRGLDTGADDYVVKPFSPDELTARINAVLRRAVPGRVDDRLSVGELTMDIGEHRVTRGERVINLGPTEFRLLHALMERPGRVFSREQLLDRVWGRDIHVEPRTVDVHIRRLRKAVNAEGEPDLIRTVRSAGYALDAGGG